MKTQRIIEEIRRQKIPYKELSARSGVPVPTIQCIMSRRTLNPRTDTITALEKALGLETAILQIKNIEELPTMTNIPLIGTIACGTPILAEQNIIDILKVDIRYHADFALICKGDSMINARIFDGDIVYIRQQPDVDNGQIAAVQIDDNATLKRVFKYPGKIVLRAENPQFPDIIITKDDNQEVRILGRAICFTSMIR